MSSKDLKKTENPPSHFDPNDELSKEEISQCFDKVEKVLDQENDKELNLMKSDITVPAQEWCLVSFVGKNLKQQTDELGMKIWGCFESIRDAKKHADKLSKLEENKIFDIFILEMYTWARIPPDPQCIDDQNYHEEKLHELITDHKRQQLRAKEVFDLRKEKLSNNPDVNQFKRNKQVLKEIMEEDTKETTEEETVQNEQALREIHGEPLKLPKIEIVKENTEETTEEATEETTEDTTEDTTEVLKDTNPYNQKFYSS